MVISLYDDIINSYYQYLVIKKMGCVGSSHSSDHLTFLERHKGVSLDKKTIYGTEETLGVSYAGTTMQGWRASNQDRGITKIIERKTNSSDYEKIGLFAIFDGHGGSEMSTYAENYFCEAMLRNQNFQKGHFEESLTQIFSQFDQEMVSDAGKIKFQALRRERLGIKNKNYSGRVCLEVMGSTATVILISNKEVCIANIGDSKAVVLGKNGDIMLETNDHRPDKQVERQRIESLGGRIFQGRIEGDLNVSRGLGDYLYKNLHHPQYSLVSCVPDVYTLKKSQINSILMGSDGIWENPDTKDVCNSILHCINTSSAGTLSQGIEDYLDKIVAHDPRSRKGKDNMTCSIIKFLS